jgi:YNFM family putative membrane transporter
MAKTAGMDPVDEAASGYLPGTAPYRRVVGALFAAGLATFSLLYSTQALLPRLSAHFEVSTASSTLSLSFTTLGLGVALLVAGPISDVTGRTRLIHASLAASAAVAFACAFAPSWSTLLVLRLLEGIALAGLPAVATAYLREELDPSAHGRAAGLYLVVSVVTNGREDWSFGLGRAQFLEGDL